MQPLTDDQAEGMDDTSEWACCHGYCGQGDLPCTRTDCRIRMGPVKAWELWPVKHPIQAAVFMAALAAAIVVASCHQT